MCRVAESQPRDRPPPITTNQIAPLTPKPRRLVTEKRHEQKRAATKETSDLSDQVEPDSQQQSQPKQAKYKPKESKGK